MTTPLQDGLAKAGIDRAERHLFLCIGPDCCATSDGEREATRLAAERIRARLAELRVVEADEVFISNALIGIRPVVQLEGRRWSPGPVTRSLAGQLVNLGVYECAGSC